VNRVAVNVNDLSSLTILREASVSDAPTAHAYLLGAAHDGTFNRSHSTLRIAQSDRRWLEVLGVLFAKLGRQSWVYREGRRNVWVIETSGRLGDVGTLASTSERIAFVRGYFDAEGGIPVSSDARFYIQFTQKNEPDLRRVKDFLHLLGLRTGMIHNPSARVDPHYWRFYVASVSHGIFIERISSWHPRKRLILERRRVEAKSIR
jgi:hypothetical protein